ncbi:Glycoside hydrolase, clan GH-D family and Glycoside hydrolase, family 27 and Glycosyl hydrolase, family 13, all-beta domain and Aldolase-type TIM barrel domain and Glycoside hydrolase, superfamily domain-containing protein [Strongyloides ratti]|uniref:Alpha-galactosidase n=1 Tax=Strongyloides ratti TaxID=34506 RepID=A0A090KZ58_STRRB|nr:Glycoside hydrolase, clan GH-D family and Glycoside hydrolase, family 27 and Glycosyl hydrolase, family 13, all-beta domain and Aldolase-type TIM barrel domain and Glycoside hydrolase, superfamily domain-containing protein [Strongyloides ratti]CEF62800.1 Glycoside hydrolase, clan GH-D family and Glycoside hydrolase, family 27 and Glycosyl hydrolase, family 13, all-beta domain and Aldolase-type TIM barrel domain and Glycoside hydrolase, superfamily domain-containing protein [Strongyloides ratti]
MLNILLLLFFIFILTINGLENGLARLPPMGWMSWTKFYCETDCERHPFSCINENLYMDMADAMIEHGYKDVGYEYIHVDDCWTEKNRDSSGKLVADKIRFPSGIPALAKYVHEKNLKFAIYGDIGTLTCGGYPGTLKHELIDIETFKEWKVDYLKLDGCNIDEDEMAIRYPLVSKYLNGTNIVYSCSWPAYLIQKPEKVNYTVIANYCNLWRNFDDINRSWKSILSIIDYYVANQDKLIPVNGPGRWNDPDMIIVGNTEITVDQSKVQMTIWSIWSSPLIMSNDLRIIPVEYKEILQNEDVIAVDQDPLGIMGRMIFNVSNIQVFVKPMTPYDSERKLFSYAVAIFNRGTHELETAIELDKIGLTNKEGYVFKDLWEHKRKGILYPNDKLKVIVPPTGVVFYKASLPNMILKKDFEDF